MATVRAMKATAQGQVRWQAMVRRGGHELSRTFPDRKRADKWAKDVEAALSLDSPRTPFDREEWLATSPRKREVRQEVLRDASPDPLNTWSLERALRHYGDTVSPTKASPQQEASRIKRLSAALGHHSLAGLKPEQVQEYVDARLAQGRSAATVRLEVMQLRALYKTARMARPHGWGLRFPNEHPCSGLKLPEVGPERDRRLQDAEDHVPGQPPSLSEEEAIRHHLASMEDGPLLVDAYDLALITGMRRGEILGLTSSEVSQAGKIWRITKVRHKTFRRGHTRQIVLPPEAADIVRRRAKAAGEGGLLFPIRVDRFRHFYRKAARLAGCGDVRFHDLRHEGISRMAAKGLNLGELASQSGHRSAKMLLRYVNSRPKDILDKLS